MIGAPHVVPTLTEVIEIALDDTRAASALPLGPDAMPLEDAMPAPAAPAEAAASTDAVLAQLQLRLDTWLQQRLAAALEPALRGAIEQASASVARELRAELPGLVRDALQAVQPAGHPSGAAVR